MPLFFTDESGAGGIYFSFVGFPVYLVASSIFFSVSACALLMCTKLFIPATTTTTTNVFPFSFKIKAS